MLEVTLAVRKVIVSFSLFLSYYFIIIFFIISDNFKPSKLNPEQLVPDLDIDDAKLDILLKSAVKSARKQTKGFSTNRSV